MTKTIINLTLALGLALSFALAAPAKAFEGFEPFPQTVALTKELAQSDLPLGVKIGAFAVGTPLLAPFTVAADAISIVILPSAWFTALADDYEAARSKAYNKCAEKRGLLTKRNRTFCIRVGHEAARRATRR